MTGSTVLARYSMMAEWDEEDLHRLVSAFLGVRFPIALAFNKMDLSRARSTSKTFLLLCQCTGSMLRFHCRLERRCFLPASTLKQSFVEPEIRDSFCMRNMPTL